MLEVEALSCISSESNTAETNKVHFAYLECNLWAKIDRRLAIACERDDRHVGHSCRGPAVNKETYPLRIPQISATKQEKKDGVKCHQSVSSLAVTGSHTRGELTSWICSSCQHCNKWLDFRQNSSYGLHGAQLEDQCGGACVLGSESSCLCTKNKIISSLS